MLYFLNSGNQAGVADGTRVSFFGDIFARASDSSQDRVFFIIDTTIYFTN
jgi:hypothetical protein